MRKLIVIFLVLGLLPAMAQLRPLRIGENAALKIEAFEDPRGDSVVYYLVKGKGKTRITIEFHSDFDISTADSVFFSEKQLDGIGKQELIIRHKKMHDTERRYVTEITSIWNMDTKQCMFKGENKLS